jgi:hypothetical protein
VEPLAGPALPPGTGSLPSLTSSATRARPFRIPDLIMAYLQWPPATP